MTRLGLAFGNVLFAVFAFISEVAIAIVVIDEVNASGIVDARIGFALVNVDLTMSTHKSCVIAYTLVVVNEINTFSAILTRLGFTLINVYFALGA